MLWVPFQFFNFRYVPVNLQASLLEHDALHSLVVAASTAPNGGKEGRQCQPADCLSLLCA